MIGREELDKWAQYCDHVEATLQNLENLEKSGHLQWNSTEQPRVAICRLYDINLAKLDEERRAMLDQARALHEGGADATED